MGRKTPVKMRRTSKLHDTIGSIPDEGQRHRLAERMGERAGEIAADVTRRSSAAAAQAKDRVGELTEAAPARIERAGSRAREASGDLRSHAGTAARSLAHAVALEFPARREVEPPARGERAPRRRHRLRNSALIAGTGAVAAYFLDPANGSRRRRAAQRITSGSAQAAGVGFDKAARVAHHAAAATAPASVGDAVAPADGRFMRP